MKLNYNGVTHLGLLIIALCLYNKISYAQIPVVPPQKIWLSFANSTINKTPPNWSWLETSLSQGSITKSLQPISPKIERIIIPVFEDGKCFYATSVEPFKNRNLNAAKDEKALRDFLDRMQKTKIPVYLSIDLLAWQTTNTQKPQSGIFGANPALQELGHDSSYQTRPQALYASPFNAQVRTILVSLVKEVATKFPSASGVVLDLGLSDREMLGYSDAGRLASINDLGIDPIDLGATNNFGQASTENLRLYVQWRKKQMLLLLNSLTSTIKQANKGYKVFVNGRVNYYREKDLSDRRITQDWMAWANAGVIDGVFLEGRWLPRYTDNTDLETSLAKLQLIGHKRDQEITAIPVMQGKHITTDSSFQRDWVAVKSRYKDIKTAAFSIHNDADLQAVIDLAEGKIHLPDIQLPDLNTPMADFMLFNVRNILVNSKDYRGRSSIALLNISDKKTFISQLPSVIDDWKKKLADQNIQFFATVSKINVSKQSDAAKNILIDSNHAVNAELGFQPVLLLADKAGIIRKVEVLSNVGALRDALGNVKSITPQLEIGKPAPKFLMHDMNGNTVSPSEFIHKSNVLITFFPKCFTGKCAQQLGSLRDTYAQFQKSDTKIIAVSVDPADVQIPFSENLQLQFPLIPDTGRNISVLYGAVNNVEDLDRRKSVLIDKEGIVRIIDKNVHTATHGTDILNQMRKIGLIR